MEDTENVHGQRRAGHSDWDRPLKQIIKKQKQRLLQSKWNPLTNSIYWDIATALKDVFVYSDVHLLSPVWCVKWKQHERLCLRARGRTSQGFLNDGLTNPSISCRKGRRGPQTEWAQPVTYNVSAVLLYTNCGDTHCLRQTGLLLLSSFNAAVNTRPVLLTMSPSLKLFDWNVVHV